DLLRLEDVLDNPIDPIIQRAEAEKESKPIDQPPFSEGIRLENVTFGYVPHDDPLFNNFNLTLQAGSIIGITGPNGSGKTTLAKLITAQHLPWLGQVLFDEMNVAEENPNWIHHNIAFVQSENLFLQGTLKENLTLWNPAIDEERLSEACSLARINEDIENRYGKYLYRMNERASDFSEGQKQRLAIARALLFKPKILILDEALSNLDRDLQQSIMTNLIKLNITVIVVSHRVHTLRHCRRLIVLEKGKVTQDGKLDELMQQEGFVKSQFSEEYSLLDKEVF
ncbi:MAG: hypothetical protein K940chlam3_01615, partial [Chlamydiae bacterium]|nr:hypothetical protein [Chlamydiota bacterium]